MDLPDEWVEAAARALWAEDWPDKPWDEVDYGLRQTYRQQTRAALAAVAPLIAAQAWDEGASWGERMAGATAGEDNPYRKEES